VICIDVGVYDANCMLVSEDFTAELLRGLADGISTPLFYLLGIFVGGCVGDAENPPVGQVFMYQVRILNADGGELPACGT